MQDFIDRDEKSIQNETLRKQVFDLKDDKIKNLETINNLLEKNAKLDRKLEFIEMQFKELSDKSNIQSEKICKLESNTITGKKETKSRKL